MEEKLNFQVPAEGLDFGISVNPTGTPGFSDLPTDLPYRAHLLEAPTTIGKKHHIEPSHNLSGARVVRARSSGFRKHFHEGR